MQHVGNQAGAAVLALDATPELTRVVAERGAVPCQVSTIGLLVEGCDLDQGLQLRRSTGEAWPCQLLQCACPPVMLRWCAGSWH
jgi:hypothetical protein